MHCSFFLVNNKQNIERLQTWWLSQSSWGQGHGLFAATHWISILRW